MGGILHRLANERFCERRDPVVVTLHMQDVHGRCRRLADGPYGLPSGRIGAAIDSLGVDVVLFGRSISGRRY
ncbi:MAG: hypothetical protein ABW039_04740 [Sphingobium sp.]